MHMDELNAQWRKDAVRYMSPIHLHLQIVIQSITDDQRASVTPAKDLRVLSSSLHNEHRLQVLATHCVASLYHGWNQKQALSHVTIKMSLNAW